MALYFFHVSGSLQIDDRIGRHVSDPLELRVQALLKATAAAEHQSRLGKEAEVVVTVHDLTGLVCLRVRLLSQVDVP